MARTATQIQTELDVWYAARESAASGKSITIATSAGSRTLTTQDIQEISDTISMLERQLSVASGSGDQGIHNFGVANFNTETNP